MTAKKGGYRGKVSAGWGASSRPTPPRRRRRQLAASLFWPMVGETWRGWQPFVVWSEGDGDADGREDADKESGAV